MLVYFKQTGLAKILFFSFSVAIIILSNAVVARVPQRIKLVFNHPLSISEFVDMVKRYGIEPLELHYTIGEIQGGYVIKLGESIDKTVLNFQKAHKTFLEITTLNQLQTAQFKTNQSELKIDSIEVYNDAAVKRLQQTWSRNIKSIEDIAPNLGQLIEFVKSKITFCYNK